jgi:hypothetical protein
MSLLGEISYALIQPSARAIGQIYADVTIEENHRDEVIITQHPVEGGGVITDHAYKRPAELEIRCGFSNSTAGYVGYVQEQYRALLALQLARQPFTVYTGKRRYRNMLIRGLSVVTDPHSENILMASVALQEIVIVSTQTTGGQQGGSTAAPGANGDQADPASTGGVMNGGSVEATGIGSQAFVGSFNPGDYSGGTGVGTFSPISPGNGDLGLGGAVGEGLDGLSAPNYTADVGEMTVQDGTTGEVLQQGETPAAPLNIFGGGNPGF